MPAIAEDYVTPSVRWGMFKHDNPDGVVKFSCQKGSQVGIPATLGGDEEYCVATLERFPGDPSAITGFKPLADANAQRGSHPSDAWNMICTKAMGRALKRAGYPETASDLKLLNFYKERVTEIGRSAGFTPVTETKQIVAPAVDLDDSYEEPVEPEVIELDDIDDLVNVVNSITPEAPKDSWQTELERDEMHEQAKASIAGLSEGSKQQLREFHASLNGRQWPIDSVSQFNALLAEIQRLYDEREF